MTPLVIYGSSQWGYIPSGTYAISEKMWDKGTNTLSFHVTPDAFMQEPPRGATIDALYRSVSYGELDKAATEAEAFAYERIEERTRTLKDQYVQYLDQLAESEGINPMMLKSQHATFIYAYVQGIPSITADGEFFGQPAGTDLSEWFCFRDRNLISVSGREYKMERKKDRFAYESASTYFTKDKILPLVLNVGITSLPDNLSYTGRVAGDDVLHVTISIPVRFERYWEWCKALFTNPEATEEFTDTNIQFTIPFIRK